MSETQQQTAVDPDRLMEFVFRAVDEVGATLNAGLVVLGDKLGYYAAMKDGRPITPDELAERTGTVDGIRTRVAGRAGGRRFRDVRPRRPTASRPSRRLH